MNGGDDSTTAIPKISSSNTQPPQQSAVIELTDEDDFPDDEDLFMWLAEQTDSELDGSSQGTSCRTNGNARRTSILVSRNLPITSPFVSLESFTHEGIQLSAKVYVELKDGDFLKIVRIIQNTSTSQVDLRGWIFRRTREMNGVLDKKLNEVCWILHIDDDDPRDPKIQGMETRQVSEVVKRRRIRLTNQSFPALSFRDDREKDDEETVKNDRVLVCRYQYLCFYHNAKARAAYSWCEKGLHRLRAEDCDKRPDNNLTDEELRTRWRGATVLGGSKEGWMPGEKEFLRQEGVCHKGITSRSSLKAPSGLDFPIGDPMQRGSVAVLLTEQNLQDTVESAAIGDVIESNSIKYTNQVSGEDDDEDEVKEIGPASSIVFPREVPRTWRKSQLNSAGFNGWPIDPSDCDSDRGSDISALRQRLRQNSIQAQRPRHKSPRITVIDAQVKTSSRSGTLEKRYEGKITSTYFPRSNSSLKKRPADLSFDSPARPTKRANLDFHVETIDQARGGRRAAGARNRTNDRRQDPQDLDSSDSDRTLGRSQSPDPCQVWRTPKRARGYRTTNSGLLTPVSDQKTGRPKSPYGPPEVSLQHHPYAEKFHQTTPLSRREHSSLTKQAQRQALTGNEGFIIDLTSSQANPTSTVGNRNLNSSTSRQPRASAQFEPCQEFLSDLQPESTSLDLFPQMNSHLHSHIHSRAPANRNSHLKSSSTWPTACRGSHTYNRLSKRADATVAPGLSSHRVCGSPNLTHAANADIHSSKVSHRRYTFGDCFCGAGGMSRGAINAGLHINWGFDFNLAACQTYAKNFFGTQIYNVWANQFSDAKGDHKVDICHLSPPCQFFSAAHTIQGKDDDMNTASLFAIFNLLEKAKPRIVTLEQTSGLIRLHSLFFSAVVNMFTARGFSVRWRVMNCADFGLPQRRMRLFIIASW